MKKNIKYLILTLLILLAVSAILYFSYKLDKEKKENKTNNVTVIATTTITTTTKFRSEGNITDNKEMTKVERDARRIPDGVKVEVIKRNDIGEPTSYKIIK